VYGYDRRFLEWIHTADYLRGLGPYSDTTYPCSQLFLTSDPF